MAGETFQKIGVIGAGAWGTALAHTAALAGRDVMIWALEDDTAQQINQSHINKNYLADIKIHPDVKATNDLRELTNMDALLLVTPAQHSRTILNDLNQYLNSHTPIVICAKGIEVSTGKMLTEVLAETCPSARRAILSGPSFAADVARSLPTAVTLAAQDEALGKALTLAIGHKGFRPYWSDDIIGVQLGGAIKNVLAIAAGIVSGRGLGASASASLISRGFVEMQRYGTKFGAKPQTLMGLSGLGDLILTASNLQSRNMSLGHALGAGQTMKDILGGRKAVTEGVHTAKAIHQIAKDQNLDLPICEAVYQITTGKLPVEAAIKGLLARPFKKETI